MAVQCCLLSVPEAPGIAQAVHSVKHMRFLLIAESGSNQRMVQLRVYVGAQSKLIPFSNNACR